MDLRTLVWYAPNLTFDFGARTWHGDTGDERAGFAFNNYCLGGDPLQGGESERVACGTTEDRVFDLAEAHSAATGDALLLTEFGATDDLPTIERVADAADRSMVGWQQWAYWNRDPSSQPAATADHGIVVDPTKPPEGTNVKAEKLAASSRPYPQVVAGTPERWSFDTSARRFELDYAAELPDGRPAAGLETEVFVPSHHYPGGHRAEVSGGRVLSRAGARLLVVAACPGAERVTVRVTPGSGVAPVACAADGGSSSDDDPGGSGGDGPATDDSDPGGEAGRAADGDGRDGPVGAAHRPGRGGSLPFTGFEAALLALAGALLALAGTALRRRRRC